MESWHYDVEGDPDFLWHGEKFYDQAVSLLLEKLSSKTMPEARGLLSTLQTTTSPSEASSIVGHESGVAGFDERQDSDIDDELVLAATVLGNYEFLSASTVPWSGHLDGTRSLLQFAVNRGVFDFKFSPTRCPDTPMPSTVMRASFWNFARQDFLASRQYELAFGE